MNKEIHYEGWLIKSPPTKRIWRARWRRRWFTLKQGEIPEQFCLEYYTDRNCRKLKGVIDLDQCEQVDCGLRLENRKQKFQYMFDIKTPRRTYYLAADTETDMRDWVNCICQVCHLHDTKQTKNFSNNESLYCNNKLSSNSINIGPNLEKLCSMTTAVRFCNNENYSNSSFENDCAYVNTSSSIRKKIEKDNSKVQNLSFLDDTLSTNSKKESEPMRLVINSNGYTKRLPENLVLNNTPLKHQYNTDKEFSQINISTGPYIPISECFSGNSKFLADCENPTTPLNNLDPKFYDTPRSHNNIGLNLTNDKSNSPKITNCELQRASALKVGSGHSSPTDSESVFTDEDEWTHPIINRGFTDRNTRPSDSSIENETCVFTYSQRFSKFPGVTDQVVLRSSKQTNEFCSPTINEKDFLNIEKNFKLPKDFFHLSDTDNTSPAARSQGVSSYPENSYNFPRSDYLPYYNLNLLVENNVIEKPAGNTNINSEKTSNIIENFTESKSNALRYNNTMDKFTEGHFFRYDFVEQGIIPPVNRKLKPKTTSESKLLHEEITSKKSEVLLTSAKSILTTSFQDSSSDKNTSIDANKTIHPPLIDRKLKPNSYKISNNQQSGGRRSDNPLSLAFPHEKDPYIMETRTLPRHPRNNFATCMLGSSTVTNINRSLSISKTKMIVGISPQMVTNEHKLQYFDLDVTNPPAISRQCLSVGNLLTPGQNRIGTLIESSVKSPIRSSVVYNSVDFVKTEAFKRIREERKKENESIIK